MSCELVTLSSWGTSFFNLILASEVAIQIDVCDVYVYIGDCEGFGFRCARERQREQVFVIWCTARYLS